jgi:hypothetical protein
MLLGCVSVCIAGELLLRWTWGPDVSCVVAVYFYASDPSAALHPSYFSSPKIIKEDSSQRWGGWGRATVHQAGCRLVAFARLLEHAGFAGLFPVPKSPAKRGFAASSQVFWVAPRVDSWHSDQLPRPKGSWESRSEASCLQPTAAPGPPHHVFVAAERLRRPEAAYSDGPRTGRG